MGCSPSPAPAPAPTQQRVDAASTQRPPDTRRLHALIVGIDRYRYSDAQQPGAVFSDLRGAVGDALRFKQALADVYGVEVDLPARDACASANAATTTLTDACATRAGILEALEQRIVTLRPGDTLLFYFAGHGSRYRDDEARDQDTGYNGTILPTDARNPDGSPGDIFDVELKALKDRAIAKGLFFVSVFDSCNSATATRDGAAGQSRSAPPLAAPRPAIPAVPAGGGDGYWVHLAAAQDGEEAQEIGGGSVGMRAGVFTNALLDALRMPGMRDATFGDLIQEVRLRVATRGHAAQTPSAEGVLTAAFGARARTALLFDVEQAGDTRVLQAGASSGMTRGSRFALYANQADAVARRARIASAAIARVDGATSTLTLDAPPAAALPKRLVAEQIAHFLPAEALVVANDLPAGPSRDAASAALHATHFVSIAASAATHLVAVDDDPAVIALRADDGRLLATLGRWNEPGFGDRLTDDLRKIARVQQLLALRTGGGTASADPFPIAACIAADGYRPTACPSLQAGGVRRIGPGERITATIINRGTQPVYVYVLAIDPYNAVDLVLPKPGEFDRPLPPNQPYRRAGMGFDVPGAYRFVVLASATPVRADAFEPAGTGSRDLAACVSPLERLLCASSEGRRDAGVTAVGDWSAQVSTVLAVPEDSSP